MRQRLTDSACLADVLQPPQRFLRSTQLERDFPDPSALDDYCLTAFALNCISSFAEGFNLNSTRRAWRFTGDYGTGKSSFALLLARCAQGFRTGAPQALRQSITKHCPDTKNRNYLPVLLTGSREPISSAILRVLHTSLPARTIKSLPPRVRSQLQLGSTADTKVSDVDVVAILEVVTQTLVKTGSYEGLLLILDEAGKFLEYAATNPDSQDVMLLQRLAESAHRSGRNPFIFVCLFHIAFSSYAAQLSASAQKEWDKVAGRFDEIPFVQSLEQTAELVSAALRVSVDRVPKSILAEGARAAEQAFGLRWLGSASSASPWRAIVPRIFPIDPLLLPVAVRFFQRFVQHERSLFNFLFSHEPFGLRAFAARPLAGATWFRLPQFFDYVRANHSQRLAQTSYRTRWPVVESVIDSAVDLPELQQDVLKVVGLLNVLATDSLRPTEDAVAWAVAGSDNIKHKEIHHALAVLTKSQRLFFRGAGRGYSIWPYSSVDLDKAFDQAREEILDVPSIASSVQALLPQRALVARRHYIQTGNLRHFSVEYVSATELSKFSSEGIPQSDADGHIIVVLCEDEAERNAALEQAQTVSQLSKTVLIAVTRPLRQLKGFVLDALRWEWVSTHTPELNTDRYANEEVSRQLTFSRDRLSRRLSEFVGLEHFNQYNTLVWFRSGAQQNEICSGRDLLRLISDVCDNVFKEFAPLVFNELVNRNNLSSAASAARMRLIELMLTQSNLPQLGILEGAHPPEMSMYLSVLKASLLHRELGGGWSIQLPADKKEDPRNMRHAFRQLRESLENSADKRVAWVAISKSLTDPPFGIRRGVVPILLAAFYSVHADEIAFYERGNFVANVDTEMFLRLTKVPELFELQLCRIDGLRAEVLEQLRQVVSLAPSKTKKTRLLEIVRPLCNFAVSLPDFTKQTGKLSASAQAVRESLFSTREPVKLLMYQLPQACGLDAFATTNLAQENAAKNFTRKLHDALRELAGAYSELLRRLETQLFIQLRLSDIPKESARQTVVQRAKALKHLLREPRLLAFTNALADEKLEGELWIASIASNLALKTPATWRDSDEAQFETSIAELAGSFLRVEHLYLGGLAGKQAGQAFRVSITQADGEEIAEVLHVSGDDEENLRALDMKLDDFFSQGGDAALLAATRQLGRRLARKK